jgi:hypothetical protein
MFGVLALTLLLAGTLTLSPSATKKASADPTAGGVASPGVEYVGFVPFDQSSSTGVSMYGNWMYLTSWKNISIYNIADRTNPVLTAQLPVGFMFENEDVSVSPDQTFLLFSESLPGNALHVYDIEDKGTSFPADAGNIVEIATVEGAGDHTTSCILKCKWAYGSDGSITNMTDPSNPVYDPANDWHKMIKLAGGAHDVTEVKNGFIIVSPISGAPLYVDVRNPLKPKVIARGDDPIPNSERGYLWHSGEWPRAGQDRWLLMQGEDNANPQCHDKIGPFATFDTRNWKTTKTFKLKDTFKVTNGVYVDGNPAANGLGCSAHWFESHKTFKNGGLVVGAFYEHGTRFLEVDKQSGKIREEGYFLPYGGSTSAAYWANDEIVYAVDYTRGLDILRYTKQLPGPLVALEASNRSPARGKTITLTGKLRRCPGHAGTNLEFRRKEGNEFVTFATKKLNSECKAAVKVVADFNEATFKAFWPKQDDDHRAGQSDPRTVKTH